MSSLWFAVTVTLVIAVGKLVQADSEPLVLVNVYDSEKGKNYTIDFSHDAFTSFHECLCDVDNNMCCAEADRKYPLSEKIYEVKQFTKCGSLHDGLRHNYSNIFNCALYVATPTTVQCYRVRNDQTAIATYPTDTPYQIFSLEEQRNKCGHQCVSVKWNSRQPVESILLLSDQSVPLYNGSCFTSTPVPSSSHLEIPNKDIDPFSRTVTTGTIKPAEHANGERVVGKNSVSDNHIETSKSSVMGLGVLLPIIISVVITVIIVLTVTFVIIWTRRKRQLQPSTTALHSPRATEAISLNNGEELNGSIGDDKHHNPQEFSCEACHTENADESRIQDEDSQAGAYASPAEVISKKTTIAPDFTSVQIQETELVHGNDNVSDAVTAPGDSQSDYTVIDVYSRLGDQDRQFENPYDDMTPLKDKVSAEKDNTDAQECLENSSLAISSSSSNHPDAYSRIGDQVRQFENPYYDMAAQKDKVSAEKDNTDAQESLESSSQAMSISNQNNVPVEVTMSTNQSFTNRAYECVDNKNMPTSTNDAFNNEAMFEPESQAIYTTIDGASADSEKTEHTKCPRPSGEIEATFNDYARLGESVKNYENPYDG